MQRTRRPSSLRQSLLRALDDLEQPKLGDFKAIDPPRPGELGSYRLAPERKQRTQLVNVGLARIVQSPGPGNWTKVAPPAYIVQIYPDFDAPTAVARHGDSGRRSAQLAARLPRAILHDLRAKWEAYYAETRPENRLRHEERAQSIDPTAISVRARELLNEARRANRNMTSREAMLAATDEMTADFETALRRKYGDIVVDVLGIPGTG